MNDVKKLPLHAVQISVGPQMTHALLHDTSGSRISNRQKDRLVFPSISLKRLYVPWIPVHPVIRMLSQITALLKSEPVMAVFARTQNPTATL